MKPLILLPVAALLLAGLLSLFFLSSKDSAASGDAADEPVSPRRISHTASGFSSEPNQETSASSSELEEQGRSGVSTSAQAGGISSASANRQSISSSEASRDGSSIESSQASSQGGNFSAQGASASAANFSSGSAPGATGGTLSSSGLSSGVAGAANASTAGATDTTLASAMIPDIPVPAGAIVPAAFLDDEERTPQQRRALERILKEFEEDVNAGGGATADKETWEAARYAADAKYLTLFGYREFNRLHMESAKEAVREQRQIAQETSN